MSNSHSLILSAILFGGLTFWQKDACAQSKPVFEDGQAQIVDGFNDSSKWIREELWVETEFDSDGDGKLDRVHVAVVRQAQTETEGLKVPIVYGTSPYFSGTSGSPEYLWNVRQELGVESPSRSNQPHPPFGQTRPGISNDMVDIWVPRGFAVVHSESPGTGLSEGCPTVGGINESLAPKAVIDWLNGRAKGFTTVDGNKAVVAPWSSGKVGMMGTSFEGTLPLAAATTGVEGLEAIIPVAPNTSYWHYYRSNGLVRSPGGWLGEDIDFLYDFIHSRDSDRRDYCNSTVRDGEMAAGRDRKSGDYNDFWAGRDYINVVKNVKAAVLMAHAFNDWNVVPEHSIRIVDALRGQVPLQQYYHQGGHGGDPPLTMSNRWFTRYLYGIENGVENDPKAWIVREGAEREAPTPYADYPNPAAEPVTFYLKAGGVQTGGLTVDKTSGQENETLVDNVSFTGQILASAENTNHRLLYATDKLTSDLHLSGTAEISIRLASSKPAANLSVWLVSLPWVEGRRPQGGVITRGWADPQNYKSLTESEPLVPGQFYSMSFKLQPDDQVIPAGQKIGLMIMSSDREFTLWPAPGTELTVDLNATSIELPIVGGRAALK
ncbi:MAG: Xaa-Pro dipeptidyl-peptidase [Bacteroidetes bacterium]|nr:Xaa-Pro dipeptidyl-peptidase [Bacteroidota bacterium]